MTFIRSTGDPAPSPQVIANGQLPPIGSQEGTSWVVVSQDSAKDYLVGGGVMDVITRGGGGGTVQYVNTISTRRGMDMPFQRASAPASAQNYFYTTTWTPLNVVTRRSGFSLLWYGCADTQAFPGGGGQSRAFCGVTAASGGVSGVSTILAGATPTLTGGYFGWWTDKSVAENNWYVIHAASGASPTKVDTGIITEDVTGPWTYWFEIKAFDGGNVDFKMYDPSNLTSPIFSTSVSTNIPTNTQVMHPAWGVNSLDGSTGHNITTATLRLNFNA